MCSTYAYPLKQPHLSCAASAWAKISGGVETSCHMQILLRIICSHEQPAVCSFCKVMCSGQFWICLSNLDQKRLVFKQIILLCNKKMLLGLVVLTSLKFSLFLYPRSLGTSLVDNPSGCSLHPVLNYWQLCIDVCYICKDILSFPTKLCYPNIV